MVKRTYDAAVELFAFLCKTYGLNPLAQICSHLEGNVKGIATSHNDPEHLWNGLGMEYTMDGFRADVKKAIDGSATASKSVKKKKQANSKDLGKQNTVPFTVRIFISDLNIRRGPGTNFPTTNRYTGRGAFTIVDVKTGQGSKTGWGLLKSGAGWICLDYAQRV